MLSNIESQLYLLCLLPLSSSLPEPIFSKVNLLAAPVSNRSLTAFPTRAHPGVITSVPIILLLPVFSRILGRFPEYPTQAQPFNEKLSPPSSSPGRLRPPLRRQTFSSPSSSSPAQLHFLRRPPFAPLTICPRGFLISRLQVLFLRVLTTRAFLLPFPLIFSFNTSLSAT